MTVTEVVRVVLLDHSDFLHQFYITRSIKVIRMTLIPQVSKRPIFRPNDLYLIHRLLRVYR